eukprot:48178-Eustigmatos_ZCMA.PRE.1
MIEVVVRVPRVHVATVVGGVDAARVALTLSSVDAATAVTPSVYELPDVRPVNVYEVAVELRSVPCCVDP